MIVFNAYLSEQAPLHFPVAFSAWLDGRGEIKSIIAQIKTNPDKSLRLTTRLPLEDIPEGKEKEYAGDADADPGDDQEEAEQRLADSTDTFGEDVVRKRKGNVLSKNMIIKADLYQYNQPKYARAKLIAAGPVRTAHACCKILLSGH